MRAKRNKFNYKTVAVLYGTFEVKNFLNAKKTSLLRSLTLLLFRLLGFSNSYNHIHMRINRKVKIY